MADPRITLTATDATAAAFASVSSRFDALKSKAGQLSTSFAALGAGVASLAAFGGVASSIKSAIDAGDQLNKLSQKVGISVEALSELKFAAELSDVSIEQFQVGMKGLNDTLTKANDVTSKEAQLLKALGVSAKDPASALRQVADAFAALPDGATKSTLAIELFGKAGMNLIPLLNGGSKAMDDAASSARKLGLVMSAETAKAAEEFNDNMNKLGRTSQALGISLTGKVISGLAEFTSGLVKAKEEGALTNKVLGDLLGTALEIASKAPLIGRAFELLRDKNAQRIAEGNADVERRSASGKIGGGFVGPEIDPRVLEERVKKLLASGTAGPKAKPDMTLDELRSNSALLRQTRFDEAEADATRQAADEEKERFAILLRAAEDRAKLEDEHIARIQEGLKENRELKQSYIDLIDPVAKYRQMLQDIEKLQSSGDLTSDQADIAREKVAESVRKLSTDLDKSKDIVKELGLTFTSAFEDAVVGGKKFREVLGGIAQDIGRILLRKSVTEPLANAIGKSFGSSSGSGGVFDSISKFFGFASGGSFNVGGSGGTDSQLVAFKASPNERVTIETPEQQRRGGVVFSPTINVNAPGAAPGMEQRIAAAVREAVALSLQAVQAQSDRGGSFARAVGRR